MAALASHVCFYTGPRAVLRGMMVAAVATCLVFYGILGSEVAPILRVGTAVALVAPYFVAAGVIAVIHMRSDEASPRTLAIRLLIAAVALAPVTFAIGVYVGCAAGFDCVL